MKHMSPFTKIAAIFIVCNAGCGKGAEGPSNSVSDDDETGLAEFSGVFLAPDDSLRCSGRKFILSPTGISVDGCDRRDANGSITFKTVKCGVDSDVPDELLGTYDVPSSPFCEERRIVVTPGGLAVTGCRRRSENGSIGFLSVTCQEKSSCVFTHDTGCGHGSGSITKLHDGTVLFAADGPCLETNAVGSGRLIPSTDRDFALSCSISFDSGCGDGFGGIGLTKGGQLVAAMAGSCLEISASGQGLNQTAYDAKKSSENKATIEGNKTAEGAPAGDGSKPPTVHEVTPGGDTEIPTVESPPDSSDSAKNERVNALIDDSLTFIRGKRLTPSHAREPAVVSHIVKIVSELVPKLKDEKHANACSLGIELSNMWIAAIDKGPKNTTANDFEDLVATYTNFIRICPSDQAMQLATNSCNAIRRYVRLNEKVEGVTTALIPPTCPTDPSELPDLQAFQQFSATIPISEISSQGSHEWWFLEPRSNACPDRDDDEGDYFGVPEADDEFERHALEAKRTQLKTDVQKAIYAIPVSGVRVGKYDFAAKQRSIHIRSDAFTFTGRVAADCDCEWDPDEFRTVCGACMWVPEPLGPGATVDELTVRVPMTPEIAKEIGDSDDAFTVHVYGKINGIARHNKCVKSCLLGVCMNANIGAGGKLKGKLLYVAVEANGEIVYEKKYEKVKFTDAE